MLTSNRHTSKLGGLHRLCILIVLVYFADSAQAQVGGSFIIDPSGGGDFISFADAIASLDNGVGGDVVFDVVSGTYPEQITITEISSAGPASTITFQSQSGILCDVTLSYPTGLTDNWVVQLNGADYITFKNICFEATGTGFARVFYILNDANNNSIDGCQLTSTPASAASIFTAIIHGTITGSQKNENNIFTTNTFIDGSYGVYFEGSSTNPSAGNEIKNSTFNSQYKAAIFLRSQDTPKIEGNQITHQSSNTGYRGVHLKDCLNAFTIIKTQLKMNNGRGCWIEDCVSTSQDQGLIANNFLVTTGSSSDELVKIEDSDYQNIYFNSFLNTANNSDCLSISGGSTNIAVMNNIVIHQSGGPAYNVGSDTSVTNSNYNNFHTNGNTLAKWNGNSQNSLSALQTASNMDLNSSSATVTFTNGPSGDLHLSGQSVGDQSLLGTPIAAIADDLDGDARDALFPYMGADENLQSPLPVELTSFTAQVNKNQVTLNWTTASETNNFGFEVHRRANTGAWLKIDLIEGHGTTTEPQSYEFIDNLIQIGRYDYRLRQIDTNGDFTFSQVLSVEISPPNDFQLSQNYPNPFNPETVIEYQLRTSSEVEISIFNSLGRKIRTLVNEPRDAGEHQIQWDGKNASGKIVASGTYYYTLKLNGKALFTKPMLLLK